MLKAIILSLALVLTVPIVGSFANAEGNPEITADQAIGVATNDAAKKKYDTSKADIEVLKVKKGLESGPIRMVTLVRLFPKKIANLVISKEYWVVYFYPKGQMEKANTLGGDFTALIDLHSGEVIYSLAGK